MPTISKEKLPLIVQPIPTLEAHSHSGRPLAPGSFGNGSVLLESPAEGNRGNLTFGDVVKNVPIDPELVPPSSYIAHVTTKLGQAWLVQDFPTSSDTAPIASVAGGGTSKRQETPDSELPSLSTTATTMIKPPNGPSSAPPGQVTSSTSMTSERSSDFRFGSGAEDVNPHSLTPDQLSQLYQALSSGSRRAPVDSIP